MPRKTTGIGKTEEAKRMRDLRAILGLSQRDLAGQFGVSPGAIAQWETGERTIPGPALRLIEIYEENLGMIDVQDKKSLKKISSSWASRTLKASTTTAKLTARLAGSSLKQLVAGNERASQIKAATDAAMAQYLAQSLGEMKGLLMKVGQMASYMDFAMPESARNLLAVLQDSTQPMAPEIIEQVIRQELGDESSSIFKKWSPYPIAAASIGQVHRATLKDGTEVAVKVQYPGVSKSLESDIANFGIFDKLGSVLFRHQDKDAFVAELRERLLEECDYLNEAENMETFRKLHEKEPTIIIPKVFHDLTTSKVLTMEYIPGKKFQEFIKTSTQEERDNAGKILFQMAFTSLFKHGVFNCDPHPGNYLFIDGKVAFLDFGCVRRFDEPFMQRWRAYAKSVLENDRKRSDPMVIQLGYAPRPEKFGFDYHAKMMDVLYEPWLTDGKFRFNRHYIEQTWKAMVTDNPNKFNTNIPKEWLFTNRLQWGLYAVLAELGAEADWRQMILAIFYEKGESLPKPRKGPLI